MICPQCRTLNDDEYVFCVNCGVTIGDQYATAKYQSEPVPEPLPPTVFVREAAYKPQPVPLISEPTFEAFQPRRRSILPAIAGILFGVIVFAGLGLFLATRQTISDKKVELFPTYLGLFLKSEGGLPPVEITSFDAANVSEWRNATLARSDLQKLRPQPEFVFYADPAEMPLSNVKLIRLDSLTDDGRSKFADFQAAIVDERSAMKRIMLPQPLPTGKYAFAVFSGFFDEGKHRFWPFEIAVGEPSGLKFEQEMTVALKPPPATLVPTLEDINKVAVDPIPAGATIAYCNATDVRIRAGSGTHTKIVGKLSKGQKVYVISIFPILVNGGGTESWAEIRTESGKGGWVFNNFLDHGNKQ